MLLEYLWRPKIECKLSKALGDVFQYWQQCCELQVMFNSVVTTPQLAYLLELGQ